MPKYKRDLAGQYTVINGCKHYISDDYHPPVYITTIFLISILVGSLFIAIGLYSFFIL